MAREKSLLIHSFSFVNARLLKAFGKAFYAIIPIKKKRTPIMITSVSAYVNVSYFLRFRHL